MTTTYATHKTMCLECGGYWSHPNGPGAHRHLTGHTEFKRRPVNPQTGEVIPPKGWEKPA